MVKNALRFVLNRAAAEYAGAIGGHELRVDLINYPFADGLDDASTLWIHARHFALGGSGYAETGSPPISRTLPRRPIEAMRNVYVEVKEVWC